MANELSQSPYASDGIARRIEKFSMKARDLNELYAMVKTRNVTHARVRRAVLLAALGVKKEELLQPPPYARVLAANKRGAELLSICKKTSEIPVSSSLAELAKTSAQAERCVHLTELASWLRDCARVCGRRAHVSEASRWFEIIRGGDSSQNVKI